MALENRCHFRKDRDLEIRNKGWLSFADRDMAGWGGVSFLEHAAKTKTG